MKPASSTDTICCVSCTSTFRRKSASLLTKRSSVSIISTTEWWCKLRQEMSSRRRRLLGPTACAPQFARRCGGTPRWQASVCLRRTRKVSGSRLRPPHRTRYCKLIMCSHARADIICDWACCFGVSDYGASLPRGQCGSVVGPEYNAGWMAGRDGRCLYVFLMACSTWSGPAKTFLHCLS